MEVKHTTHRIIDVYRGHITSQVLFEDNIKLK